MSKIYPIDYIGNTPMFDLSSMVQETGAHLYAKLEFMNPGGSIKDRPALAMILDAEKRGLLQPGMVIVEPTAGNTGIGLAIVARSRGYKSVFFVPDRMSQEKIQAVNLFGGETFLIPSDKGILGCIEACESYMRGRSDCYMPQQFSNPANPFQAETILGSEIEQQLGTIPDGTAIGAGTGGTFTGLARFLKEKNTKATCVVVEPEGSIYAGGPKGDYRIEGIGNSYIPANLDLGLADDIATISDLDSFQMCARLRKDFGLLVGGSSGANIMASIRLCKKLGPNRTVVTVLPDGMERYRSKNWVQELLKGDYDGTGN